MSEENKRIERMENDIRRLTAEQARLSAELEVSRAALIRLLGSDSDRKTGVHQRLAVVEQSTRKTAALLDELLNSKIWRTLQAGGAFLLRLSTKRGQRGDRENEFRLSPAERKEEIQLRCDSLPMEPRDPVSGVIDIKGWALSAAELEGIEITIDDGDPWAARFGSPRSDIAKLFPAIPSALHSGFHASFDTRRVADGLHRVQIRARTKTGSVREIGVPLSVDQEAGQVSEYARWIEAFERKEPELIRLRMIGFRYQPRISVLVPVFRTERGILRETVESVRKQSYPHWELCLVDDGSKDEHLNKELRALESGDGRIRVAVLPRQSGISAASNRALEMCSGAYVALLDHDDVLAEDALFHVVEALQQESRPDLLYSDEDHMDEAGRRFAPFFKPDWSPDLILSENYVCHLMCFRRELAVAAGGFRTQFDLSQDHDLLLRMSRQAQRIYHIPRVLYHWRTSLLSMSRASAMEDRALSSSREVIASHLAEAGIEASVEAGAQPGRWRVRYPIPVESRVSILIPTAGKTDVLERNLKSLWDLAGKTSYEVVIIDNSKRSDDGGVTEFVEALALRGRPIRLVDQRAQSFNYSALNNLAAKTCDTSLLLFLNDDTEGIARGWLDAMVELAVRPEVGAVGAKLLYPDGLIQHAGVTMGLAGICGHSFKGSRGDQRHYYDFPDLIRNVSAVTAACVLVSANVFREVGGFDEAVFPIAYNDIDLSLRIGRAGYRVLYTPHALLYHYEAFSKSDREIHPHPAETLALKTRWKEVIEADPFYNPNLTRDLENWSLRWD